MSILDFIKTSIEQDLNITNLNVYFKDKGDEEYIAIEVGKISKLYAKEIEKLENKLPIENKIFKNKIILIEKKPEIWLRSNETRLLQQLFSRCLTVGKDNLNQLDYYIPFIEQENIQIEGEFNTVIYGRRGAGKSSLLLNMAKSYKLKNVDFIWIEMQQYNKRIDLQVIVQFLFEIIESLESMGINPISAEKVKTILLKLEEKSEKLNYDELNIKIPIILREIKPLITKVGKLFIFIDDFHLLHQNLQPRFLSIIYSLARGNSIYLKITTIENLTNLYDHDQSVGIQIPGDAQAINLDHNLTDPLKSYNHIDRILNEYSKYTGLPSIKSIASKPVLTRLVWLSAGVPRDAIYLVNNGITKAISKNRKEIAIEDINMAASDSLKEKENYSQNLTDNKTIIDVLNAIKKFCFEEIKSNAFLIKIEENDLYKNIKKISDLKFIHVIHPGITQEEAGKKYEAYLLDYAFYTGFRKATSVKEYKTDLKTPSSQELRKLKIFKYK